MKSQKEKDITLYGKLYRLLKIRVKLVLDSMKSKKSFEEILNLKRRKQPIDIENPKTFDDKLWYIKKHFYSSLAAKCADKVSVRDYVKECGLEEILVPLYGIYTTPDEIDFENLPDECYIKCSHTSGCNYLYRKGLTDEVWLRKLFALYLKRNYFNASREWVYKNIPHRIIAEKKLESKNKQDLRDYRMFCFDGTFKMVLVKIGTATERGEHSKKAFRSFYKEGFEWIPELTILGKEPAPAPLEKPRQWERMVDIAQRLSRPFAFCRVDLYNIDEVIYLSELTFFPASAVNQIHPQEWAIRLGSWIDLEKCKSNPVYEYLE